VDVGPTPPPPSLCSREELEGHMLDPERMPPSFPVQYGQAHYLFESVEVSVCVRTCVYA
jgi:hypothetical protein